MVVVTGHAADALETGLERIARDTRVAIEPVRLADWSRPNGHSVMAGAALISGNYLLVMADHLLSAAILPALVAAGPGDHGVVLAVDKRLDNPLVDPADATYVRLDERGLIAAIGKGLPSPDAVDCGAFLATPALASAIAAAIGEGRSGSLSDGMQWLATRGQAAVHDIGRHGGSMWTIQAALALAEAQAPLHMAEVLPSRREAA